MWMSDNISTHTQTNTHKYTHINASEPIAGLRYGGERGVRYEGEVGKRGQLNRAFQPRFVSL